jgi:signal transduction histidine kinase
MEIWLCGSIIILLAIIVSLLIKIHFLRKSAKEIENAFADRIITNTNILIDISSNDKSMCHLANTINKELRNLRTERHRFQQGDIELKNAVTNISHDLRTPLTAICAYLDLLEQEDKTETVTSYIEIIRNRTEILRQLTDELFKYSIILTSEHSECPKPVIINNVLEESMAAFYATLNKRGITPTIKMPDIKVIRTLNRSDLLRVLSNILNNAVKYSDGDLDIILSQKGEIIFSNTATGINDVQVGKLFDRFYTVDNARNSTGLGLSIAKTLVLQMNGTITAKYENKRLSITLFFPES